MSEIAPAKPGGVEIVRSVAALRATVAGWRNAGLTVGLIPTMGALHAGHLSLVAAALSAYDRAIATLFVNPRQFDRPEDLAKYPRTENDDAAKLQTANAHILYAPDASEIYPDGYATNISVSGVSEGLCGGDRPGHFDGVSTVCTKLFLQSGADGAFFGEKDYQQLMVVRRAVRDLDIPIEIHGCPTVREQDGLALSSRNKHLSADARRIAPALHGAMKTAARAFAAGVAAEDALAKGRRAILDAGFERIDYLEFRSGIDLAPLTASSASAASGRVFAAAWLEGVRLIDNAEITSM